MRLKEELLKKIKEDEDERKFLENQLAKVEKEEMNIIKHFRNEDEEENFSRSFEIAYNSLKNQNQQKFDSYEINNHNIIK